MGRVKFVFCLLLLWSSHWLVERFNFRIIGVCFWGIFDFFENFMSFCCGWIEKRIFVLCWKILCNLIESIELTRNLSWVTPSLTGLVLSSYIILYLVSDSLQQLLRRIQLCWVVSDSADTLNPVLEWLHRKRVCGDGEDMLLWTETKSDKFSIKEAFRTHGYNLRLAFLLGRQHGVKL